MTMQVQWMDDGIAALKCACGAYDVMVHTEGRFVSLSQTEKVYDSCTTCGRRYRLVQYVEEVTDATSAAERDAKQLIAYDKACRDND